MEMISGEKKKTTLTQCWKNGKHQFWAWKRSSFSPKDQTKVQNKETREDFDWQNWQTMEFVLEKVFYAHRSQQTILQGLQTNCITTHQQGRKWNQ